MFLLTLLLSLVAVAEVEQGLLSGARVAALVDFAPIQVSFCKWELHTPSPSERVALLILQRTAEKAEILYSAQ